MSILFGAAFIGAVGITLLVWACLRAAAIADEVMADIEFAER